MEIILGMIRNISTILIIGFVVSSFVLFLTLAANFNYSKKVKDKISIYGSGLFDDNMVKEYIKSDMVDFVINLRSFTIRIMFAAIIFTIMNAIAQFVM